jgi:putative membrane protein
MMDWYPGGWAAYGFAGMLLMVLFWVAIVAGAVWVILRATRMERDSEPPIESGRAIADRRFASGEISAEEYASIRRTLG